MRACYSLFVLTCALYADDVVDVKVGREAVATSSCAEICEDQKPADTKKKTTKKVAANTQQPNKKKKKKKKKKKTKKKVEGVAKSKEAKTEL